MATQTLQPIDLSGGLEPTTNGPSVQAVDLSGGLEAGDNAATTSDQKPGAASRFVSGALDEAGKAVADTGKAIKQTIGAAIAPPQDPHETAIYATSGQTGLVAYRAANKVVESAESLVKSKKENFHQAAADFARTAQDLHSGQWRQGLSDAASTVGDIAALNPTNAPGTGERIREVSEGARPGGDLAAPLGKTAADVGMAYVGEKSPEIIKGIAKAPGKVLEAAGKGAEKIQDLKPEWLTKRDPTPEPQHGTPVKVESPLDGPTVTKQLGGKDLSQEALDTLRGHVGDTIPVGSTATNILTKAVAPVVKTIQDTAAKMNDVVKAAEPFKTTVLEDGAIQTGLDAVKKSIPASLRDSLSKDVDGVLQDADEALKSNNPVEVLEYRRTLGKSIDWENVQKSPETAGQAQNAARVQVYKAIGNKIRTEIPETAPLDKILQPNLELRSHLANKVGQRLVDDPQAATVEHESELKKGQTTVENDLHNQQVAKNWQRVKYALIAAGVGSGLLSQFEHFLGE
jgi:hypothetical protein